MTRLYSFLTPFVVLVVFGLISSTGMAQPQPPGGGSCPALVEDALQRLESNCGGLNRNEACYGFDQVQATFFQQMAESFFSQPADRAPLIDIETIHTAPLDPETGKWGVAVMSVQANVPNSLPGQAVTFMLVGDVEVGNAVPPEEAFIPADPVEVTTLSVANIRSGASINANVLSSVPRGMVLTADAVSEDGQWLRLMLDEGTGWMSRDLIDPAADTSALPAAGGSNLTPMQAFYFTTGPGQPSCNEAPPSTLIIQGRDDLRVNLTVNGADISVGSTIALRTVTNDRGEDGDPDTENTYMELIVFEGSVQPENGPEIPAGFSSQVPLSFNPNPEGGDNSQQPNVAGSWNNPQPLSEEDLEELNPLNDVLEDNGILNSVDLPTPEEIREQLVELVNQGTLDGRGTSTVPVVCGDGLCVSEEVGVCGEDCAEGVPVCGDFTCESGEESYCTRDCGTCGDGVCEPYGGETFYTCAADCITCGDGFCDAAEVGICGEDCAEGVPVCGDFVCDAALGESNSTCPLDCGFSISYCGDTVCDPFLGEDGTSCAYDCGAGYCGDSICDPALGENNDTCGADCPLVVDNGGGNTGYCGDSICDGSLGEDTGTCSADCGSGGDGGGSGGGGPTAVCGDKFCDAGVGENAYTCGADCGICGDAICDGSIGEDFSTCFSDCSATGIPPTVTPPPVPVCGDFVCEFPEDNVSCPADCP